MLVSIKQEVLKSDGMKILKNILVLLKHWMGQWIIIGLRRILFQKKNKQNFIRHVYLVNNLNYRSNILAESPVDCCKRVVLTDKFILLQTMSFRTKKFKT